MRFAILMLTMCCAAGVLAAQDGAFIGRVVAEWIDDDPFIQKLRLQQPFAYRDSRGSLWTADGAHVLDGRSFPPIAQDLIGPVFAGELRRANLMFDYQCKAMTMSWRAVHRMYHDAVLTQGVPALDAKLAYASVYATGPRWETRDSSCFKTCHANLPALAWKPQVEPEVVKPVLEWIRANDPSIEQIERRVNAVVLKPGPHLFTQGFSQLPDPNDPPLPAVLR